MTKINPFTAKRLTKFLEGFRRRTGVLATYNDLDEQGFTRIQIDTATRLKIIEEFYVTLTNGTIVKGFKPKAD